MRPSLPDAFASLATEAGLLIQSEALHLAPRDVAAAPSEMEQYYLVVLSRQGDADQEVRLIFATPIAEHREPSMRDVLWWLAGDAWSIECAGGKLTEWAAHHGYSTRDAGTAALFDLSVRQTSSLRALLGAGLYARIIAAYDVEVHPRRVHERARFAR